MELYIKNMVCDRCIQAVNAVLNDADAGPVAVVLGKAEIKQELSADQLNKVSDKLRSLGFELMQDKKMGLVERVKGLIIDFITGELSDKPKENLSDYLAKALGVEYKNLSVLFSASENQTIGQYYGHIKIEKVKELIDYDEMSLSQISDTFNYSSPSHLTKQFKKVTGMTPREYKNNNSKRVALDQF